MFKRLLTAAIFPPCLAVLALLASGCTEPVTLYHVPGAEAYLAQGRKILILPFMDTRTVVDRNDRKNGDIGNYTREIFVEALREFNADRVVEILTPPMPRRTQSLTNAQVAEIGRRYGADLVVAGQVFSFSGTRAASIPPRAGMFVRIVNAHDGALLFVGDHYRAAGFPGADGGRELQALFVSARLIEGFLAKIQPAAMAVGEIASVGALAMLSPQPVQESLFRKIFSRKKTEAPKREIFAWGTPKASRGLFESLFGVDGDGREGSANNGGAKGDGGKRPAPYVPDVPPLRDFGDASFKPPARAPMEPVPLPPPPELLAEKKRADDGAKKEPDKPAAVKPGPAKKSAPAKTETAAAPKPAPKKEVKTAKAPEPKKPTAPAVKAPAPEAKREVAQAAPKPKAPEARPAAKEAIAEPAAAAAPVVAANPRPVEPAAVADAPVAPVYATPAYAAPVYEAHSYETYAYDAPVYSAPAYESAFIMETIIPAHDGSQAFAAAEPAPFHSEPVYSEPVQPQSTWLMDDVWTPAPDLFVSRPVETFAGFMPQPVETFAGIPTTWVLRSPVTYGNVEVDPSMARIVDELPEIDMTRVHPNLIPAGAPFPRPAPAAKLSGDDLAGDLFAADGEVWALAPEWARAGGDRPQSAAGAASSGFAPPGRTHGLEIGPGGVELVATTSDTRSARPLAQGPANPAAPAAMSALPPEAVLVSSALARPVTRGPDLETPSDPEIVALLAAKEEEARPKAEIQSASVQGNPRGRSRSVRGRMVEGGRPLVGVQVEAPIFSASIVSEQPLSIKSVDNQLTADPYSAMQDPMALVAMPAFMNGPNGAVGAVGRARVLVLPYHERDNPNNLIYNTGGGEVVTALFGIQLASDPGVQVIWDGSGQASHNRLFSREEALEMGRLVGADYVVRGQVVEFRRAQSVPSFYSAVISTAVLAAQLFFAEMSGVDVATEVYRVADGLCVMSRRDRSQQKYVVQAEKTVRRMAENMVQDVAAILRQPWQMPMDPLIDGLAPVSVLNEPNR